MLEAEDRIIRLPELLAMIGVARSTLYDWLRKTSPRHDPTLPAPIRLGCSAIGWRLSEVLQWIATRPRVKDKQENDQ